MKTTDTQTLPGVSNQTVAVGVVAVELVTVWTNSYRTGYNLLPDKNRFL